MSADNYNLIEFKRLDAHKHCSHDAGKCIATEIHLGATR